MSAEAVSPYLEKERPARRRARPRRARARRGLDGEHIHAVDHAGRDPVARGLEAKIGLRLVALERGAHSVEVVLAEEQDRKLPERGEVQRFVELAFGHGAVAEEAGGDPLRPCSLSASARPTAIGNPPPTMALPP